MSKLRIFAAVPVFSWEKNNLIAGLEQCGHDVIHFDMHDGYGWSQYDSNWEYQDKRIMNEYMLKFVKSEHKKKKIDMFFAYLSDPTTYRWVIEAIKDLGIYTINYSCNNIASFERCHLNIASSFNMNLRAECDIGDKFDRLSANHIWFPFAVNEKLYGNYYNGYYNDDYDSDVCFVGSLNGYRLPMMIQLPAYDYSIKIMGKVKDKVMMESYGKSKLVAGFKGLGNATFNNHKLKQMRLRDIEVPACGGLHLTEYVPEIEWYFDIDKEVLVFKTMEEFYEQVERYVNKTDRKQRNQIIKNGYDRVLANHTWQKRFSEIFKKIGL